MLTVGATSVVLATYPSDPVTLRVCPIRCDWLGVRAELSPSAYSTNKYKTFDWSDIFANLLGSGLGLYGAQHFDKWYRARRELESLYAPLDMDNYDDEDPVNNTQPRSERNVWDDRVETDDGNTRGSELFLLDDDS